MTDFTIAIPTYNGEQRLPQLLERLRGQTDVASITWEVIVVDNNSQDGTARVVQEFQANFPCPLRYYLEPQQGAAHARRCAIQVAQSDLIGFLDDDNLPAPDWVSAALRFAQIHPAAGAFGSRIIGDFEVEPPQNFKPLLPFLAIIDRGPQPLRYQSWRKVLPPSAGLVVRKQAWITSVPQQTILAGRVQGSMLTGEDTEALSYIQKHGWEIWYNPEMNVIHIIPAWRLEKEYLIKLFRGIGHSRYVTRMIEVKPEYRWLMQFMYAINDLRKLLWHILCYRQQIKTDLAAACKMELLVSSLMSPIYLQRQGITLKQRPMISSFSGKLH